MSIREYVDKFDDLYRFAIDKYPTEAEKCEHFRNNLSTRYRSELQFLTSTQYSLWVGKALEKEKFIQELAAEEASRASTSSRAVELLFSQHSPQSPHQD